MTKLGETATAFELMGNASYEEMQQISADLNYAGEQVSWFDQIIRDMVLGFFAIGAGFREEMEAIRTSLDFAKIQIDNFKAKVIKEFETLRDKITFHFLTAISNMQSGLWSLLEAAQQVVAKVIGVFSSLSGMVFRGPSFSGGGTPNVDVSGGRGWGRASGGPVSANNTYLVGEEGPEVLTMGNTGGFITPNDKIGGKSINITINLSSLISLSDMENAERVLVPIVRNALRQAV